jgi:hypothetical protein
VTYLDELRRRTFDAGDEAPGGLIEYTCELFPGEDREFAIQCYATDAAALERDVAPVVEQVLGRLDALLAVPAVTDADLAQVILWNGRLGLHYWSRGVNNEFTAVFEPDGDGWRYRGFGDVFDD